MKSFFILILSLSFTLAAFGQSVIDSGRPHRYALEEQTDSGFTNKAEASNQLIDGVKEGKWIQYLKIKKDSEVETKSKRAPYYRLAVYKAGKPLGIVREYYKSGKLWSITPYVNDVVSGVRKVYTEDGELVLIDTISHGKENGVIKLYYKSGKIQSDLLFTNDTTIKGNVDQINIPLIRTVLHSKKMTAMRSYYEDGHLEYESLGYRNEITKEYYDNGVLKSEIPFTNNQLNGIEKEYDTNGKLEAETPFVKGKITGVVKHYYENGKLKSEATFMQNELVGAEKLYDENGLEIK